MEDTNKEVLIVGDNISLLQPMPDAIVDGKLVEFKTILTLENYPITDVVPYIQLTGPITHRVRNQFSQGGPGTILERAGRKYIVTKDGSQRRLK
jgi:hypothetical protein